jgi:hypothetical protein
MRVSTRAICIGILAIVDVSCGADASTQTTDSVSQSQLTSTSTTDFNATLVGGGEINLQSELQKSPVALWFWAPG